MVRYKYVIDIIDGDNTIEQFTVTTAKEVYSQLHEKFPDKISMPFNTFNSYYIHQHRKNEYFSISCQPYDKIPKSEVQRRLRKRRQDEVNKYKEEILKLQQQIGGM